MTQAHCWAGHVWAHTTSQAGRPQIYPDKGGKDSEVRASEADSNVWLHDKFKVSVEHLLTLSLLVSCSQCSAPLMSCKLPAWRAAFRHHTETCSACHHGSHLSPPSSGAALLLQLWCRRRLQRGWLPESGGEVSYRCRHVAITCATISTTFIWKKETSECFVLARSDAGVTRGSYSVALPDGRVQTVSYTGQ